MDRKAVFDAARAQCGALGQDQVDGIDSLLSAWDAAYGSAQPLWLAYVLATVQHETARRFVPVCELGRGAGMAYGTTYFGRGYCQLTWLANYALFGNLLKLDLVQNPDLALQTPVALQILFRGMVEGHFTGRKLADYLDTTKRDWLNARRIVNGTDRAWLIASYAKRYAFALGVQL
jgi:putative chitinase